MSKQQFINTLAAMILNNPVVVLWAVDSEGKRVRMTLTAIQGNSIYARAADDEQVYCVEPERIIKVRVPYQLAA